MHYQIYFAPSQQVLCVFPLNSEADTKNDWIGHHSKSDMHTYHVGLHIRLTHVFSSGFAETLSSQEGRDLPMNQSAGPGPLLIAQSAHVIILVNSDISNGSRTVALRHGTVGGLLWTTASDFARHTGCTN